MPDLLLCKEDLYGRANFLRGAADWRAEGAHLAPEQKGPRFVWQHHPMYLWGMVMRACDGLQIPAERPSDTFNPFCVLNSIYV